MLPWSDASGKYTTQAEFLRFEWGDVYLRKADGEEIFVPIERLSRACQDRVRSARLAPRIWKDAAGKVIGKGTLLRADKSAVTLWMVHAKAPRQVSLTVLAAADQKVVRDALLKMIRQRVVHLTAIDALGRSFGKGTGFLVNKNGWIATNYHVIRGAARVEYQLGEKKLVAIECVAVDKARDLAIIAPADPSPVMRGLPISDEVNLTDEVLAMGYPLGLFAVTPGTVAALPTLRDFPDPLRAALKGRPIPAPDRMQWVQFTAMIRPGSSGGPLLDQGGQVVGVNTWIAGGGEFGFAARGRELQTLLAAAKQRAQSTPLPLPPADGEPVTGWYHPDVARILLNNQKHGPGAARRELLAYAQDSSDSWPHLQSLLLAATSAVRENVQPDLQQATDGLLTRYIARPALGEFSLQMVRSPSPTVSRFYDRLMHSDKAAHDAKAKACFALVNHLFFQLESRQGATPDDLRNLRAQLDGAIQRLVGEFGDTALRAAMSPVGQPFLILDRTPVHLDVVHPAIQRVVGERNKLAFLDLEKPLQHQLKHLCLGSQASDFTGKDLGGNKRRLSGLRNKVVMLDFFADWCGPCRSLYEHERKLVAKHSKNGFVMVGVTSDKKETLHKAQQQGRITWNLCLDEPAARNGKVQRIADLYQVKSVPTILLLDRQGVIRYRFVGATRELPGQLDKAIERLLNENPNGQPVAGAD
jgi:S1-C subfamily serine protease/thiol-disulfide isomerase/thioredoxin